MALNWEHDFPTPDEERWELWQDWLSFLGLFGLGLMVLGGMMGGLIYILLGAYDLIQVWVR